MKQINTAAKSTLNEGISLIVIIKAIIFSYIITIPIFLVFAFILAYTNFPEKFIVPVVVITTIISVLIAGSSVTRNAKSKGWLNGGIVGFVYIAILYIISSIVFDNFIIDKYVITMTVIGTLTGAIGGILGINVKSGSKSRVKRAR